MGRTKYRVTGIIIRDGKVLLIHRFKKGSEYWVFPGGGVEDGESLEQGLHREIMEETGLKLLNFSELCKEQDISGNICIFYDCLIESGTPRLGGPELDANCDNNRFILEWIPFADIFTIKDIYPFPNRDILTKHYENL